ncbi:AI-2E family transporter [Sorangium cellulosum]|uniref:AI-2E family transporter n=1 Tax=Sorangium cellulosum TaxID=56 RepID=UPI002278ECA7|nr:AI-2E family transporter [Sorangium cellulosum]
MERDKLSRTLHTASLVPLLGGAAVTVASAASNLGVVLLVVFFALCEFAGAGAKIRAIISDPGRGLEHIDRIVREVNKYLKYLVVKTLTSLLVAVLAYVMLVLLDVDLALLLASSLFVLHFIPNVGAAVATIPAVLAALASQGPGTAAIVANRVPPDSTCWWATSWSRGSAGGRWGCPRSPCSSSGCSSGAGSGGRRGRCCRSRS